MINDNLGEVIGEQEKRNRWVLFIRGLDFDGDGGEKASAMDDNQCTGVIAGRLWFLNP